MRNSLVIAVLVSLLTWKLKRLIYRKFYKYEIDADAYIGVSIVVAKKVVLKKGAVIGSLSLIKGLDNLFLQECAVIGNLNWITGFPSGTGSEHFAHKIERVPQLIVEKHAAITNRHLIDCTSSVIIGEFSTVAGFRSQILTHSIDLEKNRQDSEPVLIGKYTFVGTGSIILPGAVLPDYSILGAGSLLNKAYIEEYMLYAGVPATKVKQLKADMSYLNRVVGHVK
jgi:acetyltransferase-like isoleucine patch superfamily enzyme